MKKNKLTLWSVLALAMAGFTACEKEAEPVVITVDDAAEWVAYSISQRTFGAVNDLNYIAENVLDLVDCGESVTNVRSETEASVDGDIVVAYHVDETYAKNCEITPEITYAFSMDQELTSHRLNLDHTISGSWTVGGLEDGADTLIYSGTYSRMGSWTYNLQDNHTDQMMFASTLTDLKLATTDYKIHGGKAVFELTQLSTQHAHTSFRGEIEFINHHKIHIDFQTGEAYELDLETGEINRL